MGGMTGGRHPALAPATTQKILDMVRRDIPPDIVAGVCRVTTAHVQDMVRRYGVDAEVLAVVLPRALVADLRARAGDGPGAAEQLAARLLTGALGGEADHAL